MKPEETTKPKGRCFIETFVAMRELGGKSDRLTKIISQITKEESLSMDDILLAHGRVKNSGGFIEHAWLEIVEVAVYDPIADPDHPIPKDYYYKNYQNYQCKDIVKFNRIQMFQASLSEHQYPWCDLSEDEFFGYL